MTPRVVFQPYDGGDWSRYRADNVRPEWLQRLIAFGTLFLIVVLASLGEAPR